MSCSMRKTNFQSLIKRFFERILVQIICRGRPGKIIDWLNSHNFLCLVPFLFLPRLLMQTIVKLYFGDGRLA